MITTFFILIIFRQKIVKFKTEKSLNIKIADVYSRVNAVYYETETDLKYGKNR